MEIETKLSQHGSAPSFVSEELRAGKRYPNVLTIEASNQVDLQYRISRWEPLEEGLDGIRGRKIFGWIKIKGERVGALDMREYRADDDFTNDMFFDLMDAVCAHSSELASTLIAGWYDVRDQLFCVGNIVEFRCVWTHSRNCPRGLWVAAANKLIAQKMANYSLLILKVFPLEYEDRPITDAAVPGRRLLTVTSFPGSDDWMYKINPKFAGDIREPFDELTMAMSEEIEILEVSA